MLNFILSFFGAVFDEANTQQEEYSEYSKSSRSVIEIDGSVETIQGNTMGSKISSK